MQKTWAGYVYSTSLLRDDEEGWIALEMTRSSAEGHRPVARVVFWDGEGQFSLEMFLPEAPLVVIEELISESKRAIKVR